MKLRDFLAQPGQSQELLAEKLNCSQGLISQYLNWLDGKRGREDNATRVTAERAIEIEKATDGVVSRQELRPDIFGEANRTKRAKVA